MKSRAQLWVVFAGPLVTLTLGFGWTFDNVNTVKLLALGFVAGFASAEIICAARKSPNILVSPAFIVAMLFLLGLLIPLVLSNSPIAQQIYGTSGRNLGFLHYFFLVLVFLGVSTLNATVVCTNFLRTIVTIGVFEACYGSLQFLGFDPLPWKNSEDWIFGTFGNPNYLSSFLALSAIATIYLAIVAKKLANKSIYFVLALFQSGIIVVSASSQGFILLSFGIGAFITILCFSRSVILGIFSAVSALLLGLVGVLGIFQIGPFSKYLYQDSVSYRGDYWRAGIKMFQENWLHGVGLDSYGDFYRMYRDNIAANRRGLDVFSNSAHNIFIDLAATGGILLALSYVLILGIVLLSILRVVKSSKGVSFEYKVSVILWVAFNLQTLISLNVPSLAIWGWILSGLIVAYEKEVSPTQFLGRMQGGKQQKRFIKAASITCVLCVALVAPLVSRDVRLANALAANDIPEISRVLLSFPKDADQIVGIAIAYEKLGLGKESLELAKSAISENPHSARAWKVVYTNQFSSLTEKEKAKRTLRVLDSNQIYD